MISIEKRAYNGQNEFSNSSITHPQSVQNEQRWEHYLSNKQIKNSKWKYLDPGVRDSLVDREVPSLIW